MLEIIPSILTNDPSELRASLARIEGIVERVHIDIIDGIFADNTTIIPGDLVNIETNLLIDYHLMVADPINWLEKCDLGQADRVIAQVEAIRDQFEFLERAQELGLKVGFALNLGTQVSAIESEILTDLDTVLVMSVKAGFGGQKFDESSLGVISQLTRVRSTDQTPFLIGVDGGITKETIVDALAAGAHEIVVGRRLFDGDVSQNIKEFEEVSHKLL